MKSLLERALARPFYSTALVIAAIAVVAVLWWLLCPAASRVTTTATTINTSVVQSAAQQSDSESAATAPPTIPAATNPVAATPVVAANTALPTDPALAEEELDRLKDEHTRLNDRKAQLTQQLEISNKLLTMKEQQLKTLEAPNH